MDITLNEVLANMSDEELAAYVLNSVCKLYLGKETNVVELTFRCASFLDHANNSTEGLATKLFSTLSIIIEHLKELADDGGCLSIKAELKGENDTRFLRM